MYTIRRFCSNRTQIKQMIIHTQTPADMNKYKELLIDLIEKEAALKSELSIEKVKNKELKNSLEESEQRKRFWFTVWLMSSFCRIFL